MRKMVSLPTPQSPSDFSLVNGWVNATQSPGMVAGNQTHGPDVHRIQLNPTALLIDFHFHKTNKFKLYCWKVECRCSCHADEYPVHIPFKFTKWRECECGPVMHEPWLVWEKAIPQRQMNFCVKNLMMKLDLDLNLQSSHSLWSSSTTHLARALRPALFIRKWEDIVSMSDKIFR